MGERRLPQGPDRVFGGTMVQKEIRQAMRIQVNGVMICIAVLAIAMAGGCGGGGSGGGNGDNGGLDEGLGVLFVVTGREALGVGVINRASTADGETALARRVHGDATGLVRSTYAGCHVVAETDDLLVVDRELGAIHIFSPASVVDGNVAPVRRIVGDNVPLVDPRGIAVDTARDLLYVVDYSTFLIHVWENASTVNGDVAPDRTINLGRRAGVLFLDQANDRAYIAAGQRILVVDGLSGLDGRVEPDRVVTSVPALWANFLAVDLRRDRLYASVRDQHRILVFNNLETMNGEVAPLHVLEGDQTGLDAPMALFVDPERGHVYQLNDFGRQKPIRVWHNIADAGGNVAPDRIISNAGGLLDWSQAVYFLNR